MNTRNEVLALVKSAVLRGYLDTLLHDEFDIDRLTEWTAGRLEVNTDLQTAEIASAVGYAYRKGSLAAESYLSAPLTD